MTIYEIVTQSAFAILFYLAVVIMFRIAGKRFAGQTTTFDLVVLISLTVAVQQATLDKGKVNAIIFVLTVFAAHLGLAAACRKSSTVRKFIRGNPALLILDGEVIYSNLRKEGLSSAELKAGLRKLGINDSAEVHQAFLEETGQISATRLDSKVNN